MNREPMEEYKKVLGNITPSHRKDTNDCSPSAFAAQTRHANYYLSVLRQANHLYLQSGESRRTGIEIFGLEAENIRVGRAWAIKNAERKEEIAILAYNYAAQAGNLLLCCLTNREAVKWFQDTLAVARILQNRAAELNPIYLLGLTAMDRGDYRQAIEFFDQEIQIAEELEDIHYRAIGWHYLGRALVSAGAIEKAIACFERARPMLCQLGKHQEEGKVVSDLALAYAKIQEVDREINLLNLVLEKSREFKNRLDEANALGNLATVYAKRKLFEKAKDCAIEAGAIFRELGYQHWEAQTLSHAASYHAAVSEHSQAQELLGEALARYRESGDRDGECRAIGLIGEAYWDSKDYPNALKMFGQQQTMARKIGSLRSELSAMGNMGKVLVESGLFIPGTNLIKVARRKAQESGNHEDEHTSLCALGNIYAETGQLQEAIAYFEQEVELARMLQSVKKEIHALQHLADAHENQSDIQRATQFHEQILEVGLTSIDQHDKGTAHREYALMLARTGDFEAAIQHAEAAQYVFEKMQDYPCIEKSKMMIGYFRERKIVEMKNDIPSVVEGDL